MEQVSKSANAPLEQPALLLRPAQITDQENLFHWRNHPKVRQFSIQREEIEWESHCDWFQNALQNPNRALLIGEQAGQPIGVLRYDLNEPWALVSIYLVPEEMGKGYGTPLLLAGISWLKTQQPRITHIQAEIYPDNRASIKVFEKAGYQLRTVQPQQGVLTYEYQL